MKATTRWLLAIAPMQEGATGPPSPIYPGFTPIPHWSTPKHLLFHCTHVAATFDFVVHLHIQHWPSRFCAALCRTPNPPSSRPALDLLVRAQKQQLPFALSLPTLDYATSQMLERAACLHITFIKEWKPSRAAAVAAMRQCQTQAEAAAKLGIRQQSISEALRAAHHRKLLQFEKAVRQRLQAVDL